MTTTEVELTSVEKPLRLWSWAADFMELACLGMFYRFTSGVDGKPTIRKTAQ